MNIINIRNKKNIPFAIFLKKQSFGIEYDDNKINTYLQSQNGIFQHHTNTYNHSGSWDRKRSEATVFLHRRYHFHLYRTLMITSTPSKYPTDQETSSSLFTHSHSKFLAAGLQKERMIDASGVCRILMDLGQCQSKT